MINSHYLRDIIGPFQARGLFGKRHIHKLIYKLIPQFNQYNPLHQRIVDLSGILEAVAKEYVNTHASLHDFSRPVKNRRTMLRTNLLVSELMHLNTAVASAFILV